MSDRAIRGRPGAALAPGLLALALLAACAHRPAATGPADTAAAAARADAPRPASTHAIRTTHPDIFVGNIDAQDAVIARLAAEREEPDWWLRHAEALYFRARLHGRLADLEAARAQVGRVLARQPARIGALLLSARIEAALHRFDDARVLLERADAAGADAADLAAQRAQIDLALGDPAAAAALARAPADTLQALAFAANLAVERGRLDEAERLFVRAERVYPDASPYPLAWLHTQHGIALLRNGQVERAREYFAAAHRRLPQFYLATEHLAEVELALGNTARAAELYRAVAGQTDAPEFHAALAGAEAALDHEAAAAAARAAATRGFAQRLASHPEATWQHAAEFHLQHGDARQARELARRNLALRTDPASLLLLARSEQAAGDASAACRLWHEAGMSPLGVPERRRAVDLRGSCSDGKGAGRAATGSAQAKPSAY